jgi:hypothetical protein
MGVANPDASGRKEPRDQTCKGCRDRNWRSLDNYRRELVKKLYVDAFTFEVARALDKDLSEIIGDDFALRRRKERLVAVLLAIKKCGLLVSQDQGSKIWLCFGPEAKQLDGYIPDKKLEELATKISFTVKKPEMLRAIELSEQCFAEMDPGTVARTWSQVGVIIDLIVKGDVRIVGPEFEGGLIVEVLARSTADEKCYAWFSLGDRTHKKPFMVDLAEPLGFKGNDRFPMKAAVSASEHGRAFVTFMAQL